MSLTDIPRNVATWEFMNEPMWRWFIFFGATIGIAYGWNGILRFAKNIAD
jgi:hypothetical protein